MKILIIDRDTMFSSLLASKMRTAGHDVYESSIKNDGIDQIDEKKIDAVYFDPSPMTDPRPLLLQVRRMIHTYPYLTLLTHESDYKTAIKAGCHNALSKPLDPAALTKSLEDAARMVDIAYRIGDESYDFPSGGGVISKSAFNQLFRSAIDRVGRYGETAQVLFISIPNYEDIKLDDGKYAADYAVSKLAQNLVRLRRQSDILGQTGISEYALLLQRPQNENESLDAAKRFAAALDELSDITSNGVTDLKVEVRLIDLPSGSLEFQHAHSIKAQGNQNAG
jgi:PleD family two-component response regulator